MTRSQEYSLRYAVLLRDNNQCRWCGAENDLQVHHLRHEKSTIDETVTICRRCHIRIHYIEKMLLKGYRQPFYCEKHKPKEIPFLGYSFKNGKIRIGYCPQCGQGFKRNAKGETLDHWESSPFHDLLMKSYAKKEYDYSPSMKETIEWRKWYKQLSPEEQEEVMHFDGSEDLKKLLGSTGIAEIANMVAQGLIEQGIKVWQ